MTKQERKELIRSILNRKTVKAVDVSSFKEIPDTLEDDEFEISIETVEKEEEDMGNFISAEMATVNGEKIARVKEIDYSALDMAIEMV